MTSHPPAAPKPVTSPPAPPAETWLRAILTDREGNFDTGRIFVAGGMLAMWALSAYDVLHNGREFKPMDLGFGMGALIAALGPYLIGDRAAQRQPPRLPPRLGRQDFDQQDRYG